MSWLRFQQVAEISMSWTEESISKEAAWHVTGSQTKVSVSAVTAKWFVLTKLKLTLKCSKHIKINLKRCTVISQYYMLISALLLEKPLSHRISSQVKCCSFDHLGGLLLSLFEYISTFLYWYRCITPHECWLEGANLFPQYADCAPVDTAQDCAARTPCWLMFGSPELLPGQLVLSLSHCQRLFLSICRTWHPSLAEFHTPLPLLAFLSNLTLKSCLP